METLIFGELVSVVYVIPASGGVLGEISPITASGGVPRPLTRQAKLCAIDIAKIAFHKQDFSLFLFVHASR